MEEYATINMFLKNRGNTNEKYAELFIINVYGDVLDF